MPGTGAGWDSILYKVYIIGGILTIVAITLVVGFLDPAGEGPFWIPLVFGPVTLYMAGILGYWWVKLLFGGYADPKRWVEEDGDDVDIPARYRGHDVIAAADHREVLRAGPLVVVRQDVDGALGHWVRPSEGGSGEHKYKCGGDTHSTFHVCSPSFALATYSRIVSYLCRKFNVIKQVLTVGGARAQIVLSGMTETGGKTCGNEAC